MTTSYETIFARFLGKVKDVTFLSLNENTANEFMVEWLHSTISKPFVRKLFSSFSIDDEIQTITFTLYNSIDDDYDLYFVTEILVEGMMIEWLTPRVNSVENIAQMFGNSDLKYYSQANHVEQLRALLDDLRKRQRNLARDHGYDYEVLSNREAR